MALLNKCQLGHVVGNIFHISIPTDPSVYLANQLLREEGLNLELCL
jgi:hypothetical protein